jgi:hypothetical protein
MTLQHIFILQLVVVVALVIVTACMMYQPSSFTKLLDEASAM